MNEEHEAKYRKMYENLGLDPEDFADLDAQGRAAKVKEQLTKEFCREMFGTECNPNCDC